MIGELLDRIRDQYIDQFKIALGGHNANERLLSEVVLRDEQGHAVCEGILGLPLRIDIIRLGNGSEKTVAVNSEKIVAFSSVHFMWSKNLEVSLEPFQWDCLTVHFTGSAQDYDWKPLTAWFGKWFKQEEDGNGEVLGVIHFLSDPSLATNRVRFDVDLGTAPIGAFEQLLDAFECIGVRKLRIGNS